MCQFHKITGLLFALAGLLSAADAPAATIECETDVRAQAERLLTFHAGPDDRIFIREDVRRLAPVPNPAAPGEVFEHLEVWGDIYKGRYRMRFLYAELYDDCLLMGQDILEFAELGLNSASTPHKPDGIVREMTLGDRACYVSIEASDGTINQRLAVMALCEIDELIGQRVTLITETRAIMAASCEGDPACPERDWLELIVDAVPE